MSAKTHKAMPTIIARTPQNTSIGKKMVEKLAPMITAAVQSHQAGQSFSE